MSSKLVIGIIFALYLLLMIAIGFFFYKRNEGQDEYILGGRELNIWTTALSAQASDMSGWLLMGLPGLAYLSSITASEAVWTAVGLAVGTYLNWLIVAKRLRKYTEVVGNAITIPDFYEKRFKDKTKLLRTASAVFILIFFLVYTASGFVAGAKLFNQVFGISYTTGLLVSVLVIVTYTFLGGFQAVCWTDVIQGVVMFVAIVVVPIVAFIQIKDNPTAMASIQSFNIFPDGTKNTFALMGIISALVWGLGYFGQPHILSRFMAIKHSKEIRPARIIAMIWVGFSLISAVCVGIIGKGYLYNAPLAQGAQETVFLSMVSSIFPVIVAGVFYSATLAAVMSTADSQLLVAASAVSNDFYRAIIRKKASDKELLWVSRMTVVAIAIIAVYIARDPNSSVFGIVSYAWAGFGATFGPVIILSLFWKRITKWGAFAGMLTGGIVTIVWGNLAKIVALFQGISVTDVVLPNIFSIYELLPGFLFALIVIIIVSLIDKKPSQDIIDTFESVKSVNI